MAEQKKQWWVISIIVSFIVVIALLGSYIAYTHTEMPKKVIKFETITAEIGDVEKTVEANGNVMLRQYVDIAPKVSGQIVNLPATIGQQVKAGTLLAEISPSSDPNRIDDARAQLARLQAELDGQVAQSDFARLQFQRQTQLKAENATREEEYESSRMNMQSASARVNAIQAQVKQMESNIRDYQNISAQKKLLAPISGTIVALTGTVGQVVTANRDILMRISDLSKMTVRVLVSENDVTRLHKGMVAYFSTPGYPNKQWSGELKQIMLLPENNPGQNQTGHVYYPVLFDVDNPDGLLLSGMTANVHFLLAKVEHVVTIPASLVKAPESDGTQTVRVLQSDGVVDVRKIKIGLVNEQSAQVESGLSPGDRVIVSDGN